MTMLKVLKLVVQVVWTLSMISLFTFIGAVKGYEHTGTLGAVVVGGIGFLFGAALSASPELALQLFGR
jgi:hypothetical protein